MLRSLSRNVTKTSKPQARRVRPELESLEKRDLMAAYVSGGALYVVGTSGNDTAVVSDYSSTFYKVSLNGVNSYHSKASVTTGQVRFYGYAGNDYFYNASPSLKVLAYADAGNDTVYGNSGSDTVYGGTGNDYLSTQAGNDYVYGQDGEDRMYGGSNNDYMLGGNHNDIMYGGTGTDTLYGEGGDDFLDAGSWWEFANGGAGSDFNAYIWSVGGATAADARQGGAPVCSLISSIAAVSNSGVNLASRISYLGNGVYQVGLYNATGGWITENVVFEGKLNSADAVPAVEGESWVVLTQRAYLESRGLSITSPPSFWPADTLEGLTGRTATDYWKGSGFSSTDIFNISGALSAGKAVVAWTPSGTPSVNTLVGNHAYTVMSINVFFNWGTFQWDATVTVRNPWGYDGATASGVSSDGLITLSWSQFKSAMTAYATC
jgi:hypothetical protein